jgi:hypothetical protein
MAPLNPYMYITIPPKMSDHRPEQGTLTRPLFEAKTPCTKATTGTSTVARIRQSEPGAV